MGTISKDIADRVMNNGEYQDEVKYLVTYNNMFDGGLTYAMIGWREDPHRYHRSAACKNVTVIWTNNSALPFPPYVGR